MCISQCHPLSQPHSLDQTVLTNSNIAPSCWATKPSSYIKCNPYWSNRASHIQIDLIFSTLHFEEEKDEERHRRIQERSGDSGNSFSLLSTMLKRWIFQCAVWVSRITTLYNFLKIPRTQYNKYKYILYTCSGSPFLSYFELWFLAFRRLCAWA